MTTSGEFSDFLKVRVICPICKSTFTFDVNKKFLVDTNRFPVAMIIQHCNKHLLVYIDAQYKIRGIEPVINAMTFDKGPANNENGDQEAKPVTQEIMNKLTQNERTFFFSEIDSDSLKDQQLPNIIDKTILAIICQERQINLESLIARTSQFEKALNRKLDKDTILKILDKYIQKGIISKKELKT